MKTEEQKWRACVVNDFKSMDSRILKLEVFCLITLTLVMLAIGLAVR